jgi:monoamine oxidase
MLKRRRFIKSTLAAGAGMVLAPGMAASASGIAPASESSDRQLPATGKKIIVAGAGITGLCCAYELMKKGHEVVILEASGRYGGHVFTGRDGLSDGLYADFGADHITKPGYEKFFEYVDAFKLTAIAYPNAEGSQAAYDKDALKMIGGKFYTAEMLKDPVVLRKLEFNEKEIQFLSQDPFYALGPFYLSHYLDKFTDPYQPFGVGYDDFDKFPVADLYKKEGASPAALRFLGGKNTSALYHLWRMAVMRSRGIPWSEGETFHLKGGNEQLPMAFAKRLGNRIRLNHPITAIQHTPNGVTVTCKAYNSRPEVMNADVLVNCITLPIFKNIPVTPVLSPAKQYVVENMAYSSHPFFVFEASSKFWIEDGFPSINMEFEHPDISSVWLASEPSKDAGEARNGVAGRSPDEVDTHRVLLKAYTPGGLSPQRVLAAFREVYPGKKDSIEQVLTLDWTKDKYAPVCEMEPFPIGEMRKFWPQLMQPEGRIYFAGTYADNLSRGMESCIRSAQRVALEIDKL